MGILFILVILAYLRYNHLAKKEMSFPDICKNFIPVGAVIEKVKSMKKSKEPDPDEPKPEVMNGYLQKPTVGMAAARAIRPVRSNVSGVNTKPAPENQEKTEMRKLRQILRLRKDREEEQQLRILILLLLKWKEDKRSWSRN